MKTYKIYYNDKTFKLLDKDFIPLNNVNNSNKEWFEFDIIFNFLKNNKLEDDVWYGFLPPEFFQKSNLKVLNLKKHLELNTTEYFLNKYNIKLSLRNLVRDSSNTVYSNYLIAKKKYNII